MVKNHIKRYIIMTLLICFTSCSIFASPTNISTVDKTMNESLNSLANIQKQLDSIVKTVYLNEPSSISNQNSLKQLDIFSAQNKNILNTLEQISPSELDTQQNDKLHYLLTIARFLNYIEMKISTLASTTGEFERYNLLESIFITNSLVSVIIGNANIY